MRNPAFPMLCALGIALCLLSLPRQWKAQNTGTLLYLGWTLTGSVVFLTNSLAWAGNTDDSAPVWCDISTKLIIGLSVGFTASSLCINRRLYYVATMKHATYSPESKRQDAIVDLVLGIGLPIAVMALHYIVQGHRYDIIEDIGCWPATYMTTLTIPLIFIWPIIINVASFVYASLTIRAFLLTRRRFSKHLSNSKSGLDMSRYFRLMALASTEILCSLPLSIYFLIYNVQAHPPVPWTSWKDTHWDFSRVDAIPFEVLSANPAGKTSLDINRWVLPGGAFLFFIFFGLLGEAAEEYKRIFWLIVALVGIKRPVPKPQTIVRYGRPPTAPTAGSPMLNATHSDTTLTADAIGQSEPSTFKNNTTEDNTKDLESQTC